MTRPRTSANLSFSTEVTVSGPFFSSPETTKPVNNFDISYVGDATLLRKVNESAVLQLIRDQGPISRTEAARRLGLSLPTVTRIVSVLMDAGLIYAHSSADSSGGRRPVLLDFNYRSSLVIGICIQEQMTGALADLGGTILCRASTSSRHGEEGVAALINLIRQLEQEARALELPVRGVGVGAPSIVTQPEGVVAWAPVLGWRDLPLRERLEAALGMRVVVQNEINLLALGERWRGAGKGFTNLACVSLGAGIGAGLIIDGQLYNGAHDAAGEIGYLLPGERFLGRTYDTFGSLESEAGSHGIIRRALAHLADGMPSELPSSPGLTASFVLHAARNGDTAAVAAVKETVDLLALAIANLACTVDPQRIIITGELAEFADLFLDAIRIRLVGLVPVVPELVLSDLGMDAAVLGAVAVVLQETSDALFVQPPRA